MIKREAYLNQLLKWKDEKVIKVITGIRRCGKSTLLNQFQQELIASGVNEKQIISINFESLDFENLRDYRELYKYICEKMQDNESAYIFLDEIQLVNEFQKAVDSLFLKDNVDIYLTGSNAYVLSGELATLLSGRYIEINLLPLSFREYCGAKPGLDTEKAFSQYLRYGAMPYIACLDDVQEKADMYLDGIYNTIILKDIELRQNRKENNPNKRKINDIGLLKNIVKFLASSVGSPISYKSIADYLTSSGRKVSQTTVSDYVEALIEPYIFYKAERYDILGKQLLKQNQKLYMVDLGLRNFLTPRRNYDLGYSLENVIYFELIRRGYSVNVGKAELTEIDFVARKGDTVEYYQVTASLTDENTFNREITPLKKLVDNYPKSIITLDKFTAGNYDGITVINAIDWLLG